ncbi:MAG: hypothetical protein NC337_07645 [Roseburia sp.]|nr:hypothetical protein [Roseburia sp.]
MNFMWDIALRAYGQGLEEQELFFAQAREYSPFFEPSFSCLNETTVPEPVIELNLLYRFADIFQELLAPEIPGLEEGAYAWFRRYFTDAALHTLLYTDLRHGLTAREIRIHKILEELRDGTFWRKTAADFNVIERSAQGRLAALVLSQMEVGSSLRLFRRGVLILYPDAMLYQLKEEPEKLLLYIRSAETRERARQLRFVREMFLPVGFELRVFWRYHFGIIGAEETMRPDAMALY